MTAEEASDRYHQAVFQFAYRLTLRADLAEDVTQDCFLAYLRAPGRFDSARGTVKTYRFAIARNLVLKEYRDSRVETPLDDLPVAVERPWRRTMGSKRRGPSETTQSFFKMAAIDMS